MSIQSVSNFGSSALQPAPTEGAALQTPEQPKTQLQPPPSRTPDKQQVEQALNNLKEAVKPAASNSLEFSIDDSTGKTIVKVLDSQTGEIVRQIPSEELLALARSLDKLQGLLLRQQA